MRNFAIAIALLLSLTPQLAQAQAPAGIPQKPSVGADDGLGRPRANPEIRAARKAMRQACLEDVRTLCAGSEPGGGKIMMCLRSHKDEVSQGCKAATQHLRDVRRGA